MCRALPLSSLRPTCNPSRLAIRAVAPQLQALRHAASCQHTAAFSATVNIMDTNPQFEQARQKMEETPAERQQRKQSGFPSLESALPKIASRLDIPLLDNVSSYFGRKNPLASEVQPGKHSVWILDNTAYRPVHPYPHRPQPWQAEFVAAYFQKGTGKDISAWVADIADKAGLKDMDMPDGEGEKIIAQRLQPFVDSIAPAKYVNVELQSSEGGAQKLGPGSRNAISTQTVGNLGEHSDGDSMETATIPRELSPHLTGTTYFAEPEGWAVISDIDDTIKITMTPSPIGILRSTFISGPTPVASMPSLYSTIQKTLDPTWFYLSASPYNLYTFLRPFLHAHYPKGTVLLRDASWMDLGGFLASLTQGTQAYKAGRIDAVHGWLPQRKLLCIGDSTQSDPEAYGEMARKHKGWIKAIFIRKVTDVSEMEGTDKNKDERFEKAFEGVPRSVWRVFERPEELLQAVESLKTI